jgi:hypothetical protein
MFFSLSLSLSPRVFGLEGVKKETNGRDVLLIRAVPTDHVKATANL